jgi:hypothetical protein
MSSSLDTEPRRSLPERKLRKVEGRREMRFCSWPLRVDRAFGSVFRGRKPLELARRERLVDRGRLLLAGEGELPGVMGGGSRNGMVRVTMRARVKVKVKGRVRMRIMGNCAQARPEEAIGTRRSFNIMRHAW